MKTQVAHYKYDRAKVQTGIVHIGIGNFHRAHEEFYINSLLEDPTQQQWGICGVALLPSDEAIVKKLKQQNGEYSLTICGRNGIDEVVKIGSLVELIWGVENPNAISDKIAVATTKIVTLTITEGGYNIDKATNEFILEDKNVQHDLTNPSQPKTVFGFVAEGLRKRKLQANGGITILSCDNLQHNGNVTKKAFTTFIEAQDKDLAAWVKTNVTFPNSMVDRITPATTVADVESLNHKSGLNDQAPVYCEDFIQWVIEDNFAAGRPALEKVGVEFTQDVTKYENMKLSLLNASHTLLSYPSLLFGYRKVDDAMHDPIFKKLLRDFMDIDITPYVPAPEKTDLDLYKTTLIERFANKAVSDQISRLCSDGISKFPVYVIPNLTKMLNDDKDLTRVTFLIASYRHYLKYKVDDKGVAYQINEPWLTPDDQKLIDSDNVLDFLELSAFQNINLKSSDSFVKQYASFAEKIKIKGVAKTLESI
ncbi:mannitol dehydrogenase family protein [Flavobacterium gilvum]|uniref:Mannitol dehydrogenase n=1 Tax=Flavobacterium gilvum TaxID=1492737 RepID=A0AAC9I5H9_9FLAO|nr:mannitol dehydrogenase family protein [Flavobacterium gilvum]AOW10804.1 mannitol dehydrogenase [Flavobacterium gilvum]KFC59959.1 fructuronate reductase [Flavobacterium gilvum]